MNNYSARNYSELAYLLMNNGCSRSDFLNEFNISQYNLNNDYLLMCEIAEKFGFEVYRQKDNFYWRITDKALFDEKNKALWNFWFSNRGHEDDSDHILQNELCKLILWNQNDHISIDELANRVDYARSSLRVPLKNARIFLSSYHIVLNNTPHYGLVIEGSEFNIHNALISISLIYHLTVVEGYDNEEIVKVFEKKNYDRIFYTVKGVLDKHAILMSDLSRRSLIWYLIIQNVRIRMDRTIDELSTVDPRLLEKLQENEKLCQLIDDLTETLGRECGFGPYTELERKSILAQLSSCSYSTGTVGHIVEELYPMEIDGLLSQLYFYLQETFGLIVTDNYYKKCFRKEMTQITARWHSGLLSAYGSSLNGHNVHQLMYPLMKKFLHDFSRILSDSVGFSVPKSQLLQLAMILFYCIREQKLDIRQPSIAVVSRNNVIEARMVKRLLLKEDWDLKEENIEIIEYDELLHEPEGRDYEGFDLIFCDQRISDEDNLISYGEKESSLPLMRQLIRNKRDICTDKLVDEDIVSTSFDFDSQASENELIRKIASDSRLTVDEVQECFENKMVFDDLFVVIVANTDHNYRLLQLGKLTRKYQISDRQVSRYLILAASFDDENIRFFNELLKELVQNREFFAELQQSENVKVINYYLAKIV